MNDQYSESIYSRSKAPALECQYQEAPASRRQASWKLELGNEISQCVSSWIACKYLTANCRK